MKRALLLACLAWAITGSAQVPSYVPTDGLVAWYPFDGNVNDESGNGQIGSMSNVTFTTGASGMANGAAHFNGDAQVMIPHSNLWNASSYTLTALYRWQANPSATPNGNSILISKRQPTGWGSSFEHSPGGSLSWSIGGNGGAGINTTVPQNTWVHITWVFTPSTIQFYLDGQLVNTVSSPGGMNSNTLPISVGMRGNGWHEFIGDIDHIGYWSRALTEAEVLDLHGMEVTATEGCTDPTACNYEPTATFDNGSCIAPCVEGCMDSGACNFNPEANADDGSCLFVELIPSNEDQLCAGEEFELSAQFSASPGSTDWTVINNQTQSFGGAWSILWNLTEGQTYQLRVSGTYRIWNQGCVDFEYWCDHNHGGYPGLAHEGCPPNITNSLGCSVEPDSDVFNSTDHTYEYTFVASSSSLNIEFTDCCYGDNAGALNFQLLEPGFNPNASDVIWSNGNTGLSASYALMEQGWASVTYSSDLGVCADSVLVDVLTVGCLDASACNFDSNAGCDSGLCTYPGCMEEDACNYNADAQCEGEACDYSCCPGPGCCGEGMHWDADAQTCVITPPSVAADTECTLFNLQELAEGYQFLLAENAAQDDLILALQDSLSNCSSFAEEVPAIEDSPCAGQDHVTFDGYDYSVAGIGDQCWFAENLRAESYADGSALDPAQYAAFNNAPANIDSYGLLYKGSAITDPRNLCPTDWHISTLPEWQLLEAHATANGHAGSEAAALKSTSGWSTTGNGSDAFGFNATPGGFHYNPIHPYWGEFAHSLTSGYWWTSTPHSTGRSYAWTIQDIVISPDYPHSNGLSVRCVKD